MVSARQVESKREGRGAETNVAGAGRAEVGRLACDLHVVELGEEASNLMGDETEGGGGRWVLGGRLADGGGGGSDRDV